MNKREKRQLKSKWRYIAYQTGFFLAGLALGAGCVWIGTLLPVSETGGNVLYPLLLVTCLGILVWLAVLSIRQDRQKRRLEKAASSIGNANEFMLQQKQEVERDFEKAQRDVERECRFVTLDMVVLTVLLAFVCVAGGYGTSSVYLVYGALSAVALGIHVRNWSVRWYYRPIGKEEGLMEREDYPALYAAVGTVFGKTGVDRAFYLYRSDHGFCVNEESGRVAVGIDYELLMLLTKEELVQIMWHEAAHVVNEDTKFSRLCDRASRLAADGWLMAKWFPYRYGFRRFMFTLFAERFYESRADEIVKERGDAQAFINGLYKTTLYHRFWKNTDEHWSEEFYRSETFPERFNWKKLTYYADHIGEVRELWTYYLPKELPARMDTHPPFSRRAAMFGITTFDDSRLETDEEWVKEAEKLLAWADAVLYVNERQTHAYENGRKQYIEERDKVLAVKAEYESGKTFPLEEQCRQLLGFSEFDRDFMVKRCEEMLAVDDGQPYANFFLGRYRLDRFDERGVDNLYKAMAGNYHFVEEASEAIGTYALRAGDQALLDRYREESVDRIQNAVEEDDMGDLRVGDTLQVSTLPVERQKELATRIREIGGGYIKTIYHFQKVKGTHTCYFFVLTFGDVPSDKVDEISDGVRHYLDSQEGFFAFACQSDDKKQALLSYVLSQVPQSEIEQGS